VENPITFPVRAGIAALSLPQLDHLYKSLNETNHITFTIWSSDADNVDVDKLRDMIFHFGLDKVYVDVPKNLSDKLQLHVSPGGTGHLAQPSFLMGLMMMFAFIIQLIFS